MDKKETEKPTRITVIGAPGVARQFRDIIATQVTGKIKVSKAKALIVDIEPKAKGKRTPRPDKPWEAEGISKALWYRRRKATGK